MSDIAEKVKSIIVDKLGVEAKEVTNEASFTNDLGADSLDFVSLILAIEDEFHIDIHDEDATDLLTVEQLIEYVELALAINDARIRARSDGSKTVDLR